MSLLLGKTIKVGDSYNGSVIKDTTVITNGDTAGSSETLGKVGSDSNCFFFNFKNEIVVNSFGTNVRNGANFYKYVFYGKNEEVVYEHQKAAGTEVLTTPLSGVYGVALFNTRAVDNDVYEWTIEGYEKLPLNKILLISKKTDEIESINGESNTVISIPNQTEQDFLGYGMDQSDLLSLDFSTDFTEKHYINNQSTPLGLGKVFTQPLDVDKVIKRVSIK